MAALFNNKILKFVPVVFLIAIFFKIAYMYNDIENKKYDFAKKEAEVLKSYALSDILYHENLFIEGVKDLDIHSHSSNVVSSNFSKDNPLGIIVKTVSNDPSDSKYTADEDELKAIKYFNENLQEKEYFSDKSNEYYQYAYAYKQSNTKKIISIKVPTKILDDYYFNFFIKSVVYDFILFFLLFLGINYIVHKSKKINKLLANKVKEKTNELKDSLLYDKLTSLPNRLKLIEDLTNSTDKTHLSLINIDRFKDINDLYGYKVGDEVLKQVANKLDSLSQKKATVYKLPADEFALFTTADISEREFIEIVTNIINVLQEIKFIIDNNIIFITLSSGIAYSDDALIIKANIALQIAKNNVKAIVIYDKSLDTKKRLLQNNDGILMLKEAIEKDRIVPFFQPIYNTSTKKIEKYEALARIILDSGDIIEPSQFLDIAIKTKLYPEITKAIVRKSFDFFRGKDCDFSLNISLLDIENKKTLIYILSAIKMFPEPQRIVFEIVESDKIENYAKLNAFIKEVKKYGCKTAIDDFGSGYSNFSHLFELNADYLKIDSSIVKNVTTDENSRIIILTIINFASTLGLKTIAEYVEDKDSLDLLEKMGVDFIQGYYIGKPQSDII